MKTISTFVSYQPKLTVYLDQFLADPDGETEAQRSKRWEILKTFEVNYNHHSQVCPPLPSGVRMVLMIASPRRCDL
jgi:hypothetical protein